MTKRRPRASLYARLSVAADAENVSLEGMVADMRALAEREGLEVLEPVHVDDGKSGGFRDRDEFTAWLADARTGAADVLMAYHTDRLTREGLNVAASILDVVEGKNPDTGRPAHRPVRLLDCSGIDSAQGDAFRFRFVMQAEIGRSERERIRQRSRDRARRLSRAGRWGGGAVPFGYRAVDNPAGPGKVLTIEPAEAAVIRDAADAVLSGDPLTRVARRMNHEGIKPRRAAAWSRVTLAKLLTSEHVLGRVSEGGRPLRDADGEILTPWPPILAVSQVAALRAELAPNPSVPYSGGRQPTRLLSGLLTCHDCGSTLQVARRKSRTANPEPVVMYRCTTRSQGGVCGAPVATTAGPIEDHVSARYLATAGPMPMYRERVTVSGAEELATVEAELRDILADMATAATPENFARLQALQVRREELAEQAPERRTEMVPTGRTMAEHWQRSMVDDRRALLADAFAVMTLRPGKRGPKGFDAERLVIHWADTVDAE